jgi:hypothetical protein
MKISYNFFDCHSNLSLEVSRCKSWQACIIFSECTAEVAGISAVACTAERRETFRLIYCKRFDFCYDFDFEDFVNYV